MNIFRLLTRVFLIVALAVLLFALFLIVFTGSTTLSQLGLVELASCVIALLLAGISYFLDKVYSRVISRIETREPGGLRRGMENRGEAETPYRRFQSARGPKDAERGGDE